MTSTSWLTHLAAASFDDGASARFATRANSTLSAVSSRRRPFSRRRISFPMPSRAHSASSTQVPPSGLDSANSGPSAEAARAAAGSRNRVTEAASRCSASRFAVSSRPKLYTTRTADLRFCGSQTLWASWR